VGRRVARGTQTCYQSVRLSRKAGGVAVLVAWTDDSKVGLLVAATDDVVKKGVHAGKLVGEAAKVVGGKGGGWPDMAQAGGWPAGAPGRTATRGVNNSDVPSAEYPKNCWPQLARGNHVSGRRPRLSRQKPGVQCRRFHGGGGPSPRPECGARCRRSRESPSTATLVGQGIPAMDLRGSRVTSNGDADLDTRLR